MEHDEAGLTNVKGLGPFIFQPQHYNIVTCPSGTLPISDHNFLYRVRRCLHKKLEMGVNVSASLVRDHTRMIMGASASIAPGLFRWDTVFVRLSHTGHIML